MEAGENTRVLSAFQPASRCGARCWFLGSAPCRAGQGLPLLLKLVHLEFGPQEESSKRGRDLWASEHTTQERAKREGG